MALSRPRIRFRTQQTVVREEIQDPFVGFEHLGQTPDGFMWDAKRWCSPFDLRLPTLPRLTDASPQGVSASEFFLPGVGNMASGDLEVIDINEKFENYERLWIPKIRSGHYYHYNVPFYYFSDDSRVQYVDPNENIDEKNVVLLDHEPNINTPIYAANYIRDTETGEVTYKTKVQQMYAFTGTYTNGEENDTSTPLGKIIWENVNYNKREFVVDNTYQDKTYLRFNRDYTETYGVEPVVVEDLAACKVIGISNGSEYQTFYLPDFPVIKDSFTLYTSDGITWNEWTQADTWFDLISEPAVAGVNRYYLDKDLGIVYFSTGIDNSVPDLGLYIVCRYTTTLRVEYEEEGDDLLLDAWNANTSPVSQFVNQGFVCITHQELEPAFIRLSINKQPIPFTFNPVLHGPITTGSDFALLKADVTTYDGIPVPDVEVNFTMDPTTIGFLDGAETSVSVTNERGEAFSTYQPPTSANTLGHYITNQSGGSPKIRPTTNVSYPNHIDVIIPNLNSDMIGKEDSTYIYQILKDDLLLGYDNVDDWIEDNLTQPPWVNGDPDNLERWKREVKLEYDLKDWFEINTEAGVKPDGTMEGRKVVLYTTSSTKTLTINIEEVILNFIARCTTQPKQAHGLSEGDTITIHSSTSYNNTYTVASGGDEYEFFITANPTFGDDKGKFDIVTNQNRVSSNQLSNEKVLDCTIAPFNPGAIILSVYNHDLVSGDTVTIENSGFYNGTHTVDLSGDDFFTINTPPLTPSEEANIRYDRFSSNIDSTAINPVTGETGAIIPLRPVLVETIDDAGDTYDGYVRLIYPEDSVPTPDPADSNNLIGGYWVVSTARVDFQANCWSPRRNATIYSNTIAARISLPNYLLGEYINDDLEKVPFGWKLFSDTDNYAAGLNGATFLTINATTGPYKILDIINGTETSDWASAPFKSLAFQVEV